MPCGMTRRTEGRKHAKVCASAYATARVHRSIHLCARAGAYIRAPTLVQMRVRATHTHAHIFTHSRRHTLRTRMQHAHTQTNMYARTHAHMHTCTASMCTANALVRHVDLGRVERMTAHAHKAWRWHAAHARQSRVPLTQALADVRAPHARVTFACGMACRMHAPRLIDDRSPFPTKPHLL